MESLPIPDEIDGPGSPAAASIPEEAVQGEAAPAREDAHERRRGPATAWGGMLTDEHLRGRRRPRVLLPVLLLLATCASTFFAGAMSWEPFSQEVMIGLSQGWDVGLIIRQSILRHADQGVVYMVSVISILFAHEMGHFVATRIYRIPASLPYFIPFPFAPLGTMGAVIGMQGGRADRREIFDIGLAGPLAGLVLALPVVWLGVAQLDLTQPGHGTFRYDLPLLVRWMLPYLHPGQPAVREVYASQVNALFMAGWVGLLITGLNMMPVSQLDGGHVVYTLLGRRSRWITRLFVLSAAFYMILSHVYIWVLMLVIIFFLGLHHPPTANDRVRLGWPRTILGYASLLIPVLCFPLRGLIPVETPF